MRFPESLRFTTNGNGLPGCNAASYPETLPGSTPWPMRCGPAEVPVLEGPLLAASDAFQHAASSGTPAALRQVLPVVADAVLQGTDTLHAQEESLR
jgi:hypothetical protein